VASVSHLAPIHLGLDVHRDTISVGVLGPGGEVPAVDKIAYDEPSVRRLVGRLGDPRRLPACYEAGPTGFELARLLHSMGVSCQVIAPSLIPKAPGDRVKTDKRDCRRLARRHRAGELVAIRIPTPVQESVRDLCRTRADMVADRMRARHRLSKFLLRHGQVWRDGKAWTLGHERWLLTQRFTEPALQTTYDHLARRQQGLDPQVVARAWAAQLRLRGRFRRLRARKTSTNIVAAAIARELAGFLWAEMTA
jgi:transposase